MDWQGQEGGRGKWPQDREDSGGDRDQEDDDERVLELLDKARLHGRRVLHRELVHAAPAPAHVCVKASCSRSCAVAAPSQGGFLGLNASKSGVKLGEDVLGRVRGRESSIHRSEGLERGRSYSPDSVSRERTIDTAEGSCVQFGNGQAHNEGRQGMSVDWMHGHTGAKSEEPKY